MPGAAATGVGVGVGAGTIGAVGGITSAAFIPAAVATTTAFTSLGAGALTLGSIGLGAATGFGISTIGAIISAGGQLIKGITGAGAADAQAAAFRNQAIRARQVANLEADQFKRQQHRLLGKKIAQTQGVVPTVGSPLLTSTDFVGASARGEEIIREGGRFDASQLNTKAGFQDTIARNRLTGGFFSAGSSLLSGFGSPVKFS